MRTVFSVKLLIGDRPGETINWLDFSGAVRFDEMPWRVATTNREDYHFAFLRHLIARLESAGTLRTWDCADHLFAGQLKTLLAGAELPLAGNVGVPWDIAHFSEHLESGVRSQNAEFITVSGAADAKASSLQLS